MGHGVSAAMLTGVVKSAFRTSSADGYEPAAVVGRLRNNMAAFGPERFVTLIAAILSADEERLVYVNAGHPPGLLCNAEGGRVWLSGTGPLISTALPACTWEQRSVPMVMGDRLLLYTDGVSDALMGEDDLGEEAISSATEQYVDGGAPLLDELLTRVRARFGGRPQPDDLTLLTAKLIRH